MRINEDGTIRMIMQDGINNNTTYTFNLNRDDYTYMYYSSSKAKTTLDSWYQTNIGSKSDLAKNVASGAYYCEQLKVSLGYNMGSATATNISDYVPDFKCNADSYGKGIVNTNIGLLSYDEVIYAGLFRNLVYTNNYLVNGKYWWLMTSVGANNKDSLSGIEYFTVYYQIGTQRISLGDINTLRPVINLKSDTQATGTGTSSDPFVIE